MTKRYMLVAVAATLYGSVGAQNLIVNPGAELLPAGTGWTVVLAAGSCAAGTAAGTYNNWTMIPDGSANYPAAQGGVRTFFAGCGTVGQGPYELRQTIDVSGDAAQIDVNNVAYTFSGYIQTPIAAQADGGRFTVEYLNAANAVIPGSYTVVQSGSGGSGNGWNLYTNTRLAPVGTRAVRIRMIASLVTGPAVNAYFDNLSLERSYIVGLPVQLLSFAAKDSVGFASLEWRTGEAYNFHRFEVERSPDGQQFTNAGSLAYQAQRSIYRYSESLPANTGKMFYRLKMVDIDGRFTYSEVLMLNFSVRTGFMITPNPASSGIRVTGLLPNGQFFITDMTGRKVYQSQVTGSTLWIDAKQFTKGVYIATCQDGKEMLSTKLIIE